MVTDQGEIKISDFGVAKVIDSLNAGNRFSIQGSVYWMAPEIVRRQQYTSKADIWSLGCLLLEMLTGEHPWGGFDQIQAMYQIGFMSTPLMYLQREFEKQPIPDVALAFMERCMTVTVEHRPTASELFSDPFVCES